MKYRPSKRPFHLSLGERGETAGWKYLADRDYKILEKNFRCPLGEIDVIAVKDGRLIFIEIKTRSGDRFGSPQEAVTPLKQKKLLRLAEWYMKSAGKNESLVSFHVLAVSWTAQKQPEFLLIENAFTA